MFDWICALTADCLTCKNNKPNPKHRNEVPLEEWQNEGVRFGTIHIDHRGPLHPPNNQNFPPSIGYRRIFSIPDCIPSYKKWS